MFQVAINNIIARYKAAIGDGKISFVELVGLLQGAVIEFVTLAQSLALPGADKKTAVLAGLEQFIDQVITPIDLPYIPNLIEPYVDAQVKSTLLSLANVMIDRAVAALKQTGLFVAPTSIAAAPPEG